MSEIRHLNLVSEQINSERNSGQCDTSHAAIQRIIENLVAGWSQHPHSAMEYLVLAARVYPLSTAHRIIGDVVRQWRVRKDYSWKAGGNADHCFLAALCLSANGAFAEDLLIKKCAPTVLSIYNEDSFMSDEFQKSPDYEAKKTLLTSFLIAGVPLGLEQLYEAAKFDRTCQLIVPDFQQINLELMAYLGKHPERLQDLEWRKFEELLDAIFKNQGYHTELGPGSNDGGVDLRLIQKDSIGQVITLVQAKRYKAENPIDLQAVQALHGVVDDQRAHRGLFVTTSRYLPVAKNFAARQNGRLMLATSKEVATWCKSIVNR